MLRTVTALIITAVLAAAAVAVMAPPAAAANAQLPPIWDGHVWTFHYVGEHAAPAADAALVAVAVGFWRARGITGCPNGVEALAAPTLAGPDVGNVEGYVAGRGIDCRLWVAEDIFGLTPLLRCDTVVHEVGHALGLVTGGVDGHGHTATGIMRSELGRALSDSPYVCRTLGHRPRRHRARARTARRHHPTHQERNRSWATARLPRR